MQINVPESEFKPLLDRDKAAADVREHLGPWTGLMHDLTNYGSNLIPRCYNSSEKQLKDALILGVLLRQVVAMLDGVQILLSSGATHAAHLELRALFEASVYIEWMLARDSEEKATYYYVHDLRRQRLWATRLQPGSPERNEFTPMMNKWGVDVSQYGKMNDERMSEIDRVLSEPQLAAVNKDFEKHRREKHDAAWYVPLGQRNFRRMVRTLGKEALYMFIYSGASEVMHASSYGHHVRFSKGEITFRPIRSPEEFVCLYFQRQHCALYVPANFGGIPARRASSTNPDVSAEVAKTSYELPENSSSVLKTTRI